MTSHTVLFVHIGPKLPSWLSEALFQARLFNDCPIVLVAEAAALADARHDASLKITHLPLENLGVSGKQKEFRKLSIFDRSFRDGFWTFTTERFFVIESAIEHLSLENVIHLENDVLLYCDLSTIISTLKKAYPGIGATFDNDERCVPGIMYVAGKRQIADLNDYILATLHGLAASASARERLTGLNDMMLLGAYRASRGRHAIDNLPIVPPDYPAPLRSRTGLIPADPSCYWNHFDTLRTVFDAAALGQFLGGVDPRNISQGSVGFINESCVFDPRILKTRMALDASGRIIPIIETASGIHPVVNLHIHSKNPRPFLSVKAPFNSTIAQ